MFQKIKPFLEFPSLMIIKFYSSGVSVEIAMMVEPLILWSFSAGPLINMVKYFLQATSTF